MKGKKLINEHGAIILALFVVLVLNLALGAYILERSHRTMMELNDERMIDIVRVAAGVLDGDVLDTAADGRIDEQEYEDVLRTLSAFYGETLLSRICVYRQTEDGTFIKIADPADVSVGGQMNDELTATGQTDGGKMNIVQDTEALRAAAGGMMTIDKTPKEDIYGEYHSAYGPVMNSDGKVAGVIEVGFRADWYEKLVNQNYRMLIGSSVMFFFFVLAILSILNLYFRKKMRAVTDNLMELSADIDELTKEVADDPGVTDTVRDGENVQTLGGHVAVLRSSLQNYISHAKTEANYMAMALAEDYRSVYFVDLDKNDAVCYREDKHDLEMAREGDHFPYLERFRWYAENIVDEKDREVFLQFIEPDNIRKSLETRPTITCRYLARQENRECYLMIRVAGVRRVENRDDPVVHAIGMGIVDVDEGMRQNLAKNQALADALSVAVDASRSKTAFLSNMSHEIRTPMNVIIGLNSLALQDETLSDQTREYLEKTGESARHLLGLINDILDMSRIESGKVVLNNEEFSFAEIMEQVNTMAASQCREKNLTYEYKLLSHMDGYYIGDALKLKQVLINILSNSVKFTEAPGKVTLTVERIAEYDNHSSLKFDISDTGIGMDKSFIPKIFDSFTQEDPSRVNKYGSTGLGMAITKNIVEMMNGKITVESEKGVGSTFTVVVTLRNSESTHLSGDGAIDLKGLRVLVVDDDEVSAEHARTVLLEVGITADTCPDGQTALTMLELQHAKMEPYNLMLLDWKMPEMDGIETAREIRKRFESETTIIILTAYSWDDIKDEAMQAGIDKFLSKPLFASSIMSDFERIASRDNWSIIKEKGRADLSGRRVLLAEDVMINAKIMAKLLASHDIQTDHAKNGRAAVDMFRESFAGYYCAVLMDVRMPEMDGLEATAAIRALDREDAHTIPIIAMTANAFDEDVQQSLQAGMNAHLSKPVEAEDLFRTLEELVWEAESKG